MVRVLFKNGLIFDGRSPDLLADCAVAVEGGVITAVMPNPPEGSFDQVVDLKGRTLMPGLIDAHYHAYAVETDFVKLEAMPRTYLGHRGAHLLNQSLMRGFTTVRDVGGADHGLWRVDPRGVCRRTSALLLRARF